MFIDSTEPVWKKPEQAHRTASSRVEDQLSALVNFVQLRLLLVNTKSKETLHGRSTYKFLV